MLCASGWVPMRSYYGNGCQVKCVGTAEFDLTMSFVCMTLHGVVIVGKCTSIDQ